MRTIEYDMTDFMKSCIELYSSLIDSIAPVSSKLIKPADLPTESSGGGNAPAMKLGDRWEHFLAHKAWRRFHDRHRTALCTPIGAKGGPTADTLMSTRITRMSFVSWTDQHSDSVVKPDG